MEKIKENRGQIALYIAIWLGFASLLFYYTWWLTPERLASPLLLFGLACALVYGMVQLAGNWILYLAAGRYQQNKPQKLNQEFTVDVFVTAYNEDVGLIERCLTAARDMRTVHRTWLLDDSRRPELQALANYLGTDYLTRDRNIHHKAGNINAAIRKTAGDVVVIFDIDHVPQADFLEKTLGFFNDPQLGFVQVMLTFAYKQDSVTAKAASESSLDFYNPASRGSDALGSATLIGSNALIRREALDSICGYQPGLAEDLATSIDLHVAGWRSVYVNKPLAPGLAPPDLKAWFDQQFKWSRGVFELLITKYVTHRPSLTYGQQLGYAIRMTYYWIGLAILVHLLATIFVLLLGDEQAMIDFRQYLLHLTPMAMATMVIRSVALRRHADASVKMTLRTPVYLQWKPLLLVAGTWPAYSLSWFLALFRVPTGFRPTPKEAAARGPNPAWILPQITIITLLLIGIIASARKFHPYQYWLVYGFSMALLISQLWIIILAIKESFRKKPSTIKNQENKSIVKDSL